MKQSILLKLVTFSAIFAIEISISVNAQTPASNIPSKQQNVTASNTQNNTFSLEEAVFDRINEYRQGRNLPSLIWDNRISASARTHSRNMASGNVQFGHNGFAQRVQVIGQVIPYQVAAENVAYNQGYFDPATNVVKGWLNSIGHKKNIVGKYNLTGVGVAKNARGEYYFTQIFILEQ